MSATPVGARLQVWGPNAATQLVDGGCSDLHLATVDGQGRVAVRGPALVMGWERGHALSLTVRDDVVRLARSMPPAYASAGVGVIVDARWRVLLPYGIRVRAGWEPGLRLMVVAVPVQGVVAVLAVSRVVSAFVGGP